MWVMDGAAYRLAVLGLALPFLRTGTLDLVLANLA